MGKSVLKGILIGAALVGAAFAPGLIGMTWLFGLKSVFLTAGLSLAVNSVASTGMRQKQGFVLGATVDTQAPLPVVYGTSKVGVRYADRRTGGDDNKYLYLVCALCHGSEDGTGVAGIDEVFFDDRLAVDQDGVIQSEFQDKLTCAKYLGTDSQANDGTMFGAFPLAWPGSSNGHGVAYLVLRLTYDPEVYPTGEPTVTAIVRGQKCKNPANLALANAFSTNPAWCLYDLLTSLRYGLGCAPGEVDAASFATMATYYDTVVTKNSTTGATDPLFSCNGVVDVGQSVAENIKQLLTSCRGILVYEGGKYRLLTRRVVSPTSFTLTEDNIHGDWSFNVPGVGDAPNRIDALYVEPGFGPYITSILGTPATFTCENPHDLAVGDRVYIYETLGQGQNLTPSVLGYYTVDTAPSTTTFTVKDRDDVTPAGGVGYNVRSCRAAKPENFPHQVATRIWPRPGTANGYLTADNSYEVIHELALPFTNDVYTAEQIALVTLKEARAGLSVTLTASEAALQLVVGDLVPVTHTSPGWVAKNFWVMGVFLIPNTMLVRLALLEYDATAYSLDALSTIPTTPKTTLPNPNVCLPPTGLILSAGDAEARPDLDGSHKVYIKAEWTSSLDPYVEYYQVQYRSSDSESWLPSSDPNRTATVSHIGPLSEGVTYDVQVRAVNVVGKSSEWIVDEVTPQLSGRSGSMLVDAFTTQTPGRRWIQKGGTGTFVDIPDPDAVVGESLGRATGPVWMEFADSIPYDPDQVVVIRMRIRQNRNPTSGSKACYLGLTGVAQTPGQPGVYTYVNTIGQDAFDDQHFVLMNGDELEEGRAFTDVYAYVKGYAGGRVTLTSDMLTNSGLTSFNAANCVDGDTTPSQVAFTTNSAVGGAYLLIDLGVARAIVDARLHMAAAGSTAAWDLEYADSSGGPWTKVT